MFACVWLSFTKIQFHIRYKVTPIYCRHLNQSVFRPARPSINLSSKIFKRVNFVEVLGYLGATLHIFRHLLTWKWSIFIQVYFPYLCKCFEIFSSFFQRALHRRPWRFLLYVHGGRAHQILSINAVPWRTPIVMVKSGEVPAGLRTIQRFSLSRWNPTVFSDEETSTINGILGSTTFGKPHWFVAI